MADADAAAPADLDGQISQFLAFTGSSDVERARSYLEMSGGDLETAASLFLEHAAMGGSGSAGGAGPGPGGGGSAHPPAPGGGFSPGPTGVDVRAPDRTQTMRLMDYDDGPGSGSAMSPHLAAMAMEQERLLAGGGGGGGMLMGGGRGGGLLGDALSASLGGGGGGGRRGGGARLSAFASSGDGAVDVPPGSGSGSGPGDAAAADLGADLPFDAREAVNRAAAAAAGEGGAGEVRPGGADAAVDAAADAASGVDADVDAGGDARRHLTSLEDMFAPPDSLIYAGPGGFQGARQAAKDSRRWLLVNIQSDSDFACHALNRDVWRDELVENLVRDGFIFWQAVNAGPEGRTYVSRYGVQSYPHVGIIDPRTARLMWKREGWTQVNPMTAPQFAEAAADFCSRHSFERPPSAPRSASTASCGGGGGGNNKRPIEAMTEEEQLEAAIRASMSDAGGAERGGGGGSGSDMEYDDDDMVNVEWDGAVADESVVMGDADAGDGAGGAADGAQAGKKEAEEEAPQSFEDELLAVEVGGEPATGEEGVGRVQIRMPDGKRLVRRFRGSDQVRTIFAFVQQSNEDAGRGKDLDLKAGFPPKNLLGDIDKTISECGLAGEAITARWK